MAFGKSIERLFVDIIGNNTNLKKALKQSDSAINEFARNTSKKLNDVGASFTNLGRKATTALTLPLLGIAAAATKIGIEFETQFNRVIALTNATEEETKALRTEIKRLGAETPFTTRQVAEAFQFLALAGFSAAEAIEAASGTLELAQAGSLDLATAADIATNVLKAFRLEAEDLGRVNDVLAFTASNANTNIQEFAEAAKIAAPVAAELNIPVEELATQIGFLANAGIKGSLAGTALRRGLLNLSAPTEQQAKELAKLNINTFDLEGNFVGLNNVIGELEKGLAGSTQEQKAQSLELLFGARAVSSFAVLLNEGKDSLDDFTDSLEESEGTAARIAETNLQGAPGAVARFKSALEALFLTLSEQILPVLTTFLNEILTPLVIELGKADDATVQLAIKIGILAASLGPLLLGVGLLFKILAFGINIFLGLGQAIQIVSAGLKLLFVALGTASGGLLVLLAVLIPLLLANEEFRALLFSLLAVFLDLLKPLLRFVKILFDLLLPILTSLIDILVPLIEIGLIPFIKVLQFLTPTLEFLVDAFELWFGVLKKIYSPLKKVGELLGIFSKDAKELAGTDVGVGFNVDEFSLPDFGNIGIGGILGGNNNDNNEDLSLNGEAQGINNEFNYYGITSEEATLQTKRDMEDIMNEQAAQIGVE